MKKIFPGNLLNRLVFLVVLFISAQLVDGQDKAQQGTPIPDSINAIFMQSCMPCHGSAGGRYPTAKLNFSRWEGYGAAREVEKAVAICNSVRKGTMPTKSFRTSNPGSILTKAQVAVICEWADALKQHKNPKTSPLKRILKKVE